MNIINVTDPAFQEYGKVWTGYDCSSWQQTMENMEIPVGVDYVPSVEALENCELTKQIKAFGYGQLPIQVGFCSGHNHKLDALEYHRCSEFNYAATDLILLLGRQQDIKEDSTYKTDLVKAFFVPKGTLIEVYATTLHYAPCQKEDTGFQCVVVLTKETNEDLETNELSVSANDEPLLFAKNKWLISHEDAQIAGSFVGLIGENKEV